MTTEATKRAPYAKSTQRKAAIAQATLEVVDEVGHSRVTSALVAKRLGIPEATVLYHFPTRAHLLLAALERSDSQYGERLRAEYADELHDPSDFVSRLARFGATEMSRRRLYAYLLGEAADPEHPAHPYFVAHYLQARTAFARVVRQLQAEGIAHPDLDPEIVARQISAAWTGLQSQWLLDPSFDFVPIVELTVRHLTRQDSMEARQAIEQLAQSI